MCHARWLCGLLAVLLAAFPGAAAADEPADLLQAAIGDHPLVLLGEMHGTREIPAMTAELVRRYARSGPVLLALEADAGDQARLDRFLDSGGGEDAKDALLGGTHWQDAMHDGRDSVAMFELLEDARRLRASGARVDVVLFDAAGAGDRDARMGRVLRNAIAAHPRARALVLTGNVHAMTGAPMQMFSADGKAMALPETMGHHLADLAPLSVEIRAGEGDFWICQARCGISPVRNPRHVEAPSLTDNEGAGSWDLTLLIPRFSASRPAVEAR